MLGFEPDHSATIRAGRAYVRLIEAAGVLAEWEDDDRSRRTWQRRHAVHRPSRLNPNTTLNRRRSPPMTPWLMRCLRVLASALARRHRHQQGRQEMSWRLFLLCMVAPMNG